MKELDTDSKYEIICNQNGQPVLKRRKMRRSPSFTTSSLKTARFNRTNIPNPSNARRFGMSKTTKIQYTLPK